MVGSCEGCYGQIRVINCPAMAAGGDTRTKRDAIGQIFTPGIRRRLGVLTALGFSSGLPLALTDSTLQAWLAETDIDIKTIGLFSLVTMPYV